jgi:heme exporter protein A
MQLSVETLTLVRGQRVLARDLSFKLAAGEVLLLKGPNGAGKTTLLRTLAGLLPLSDGRVIVDDARAAPDQTLGERWHFVGHANAVKPALTGRENLAFWARYLAAEGGPADAAGVQHAVHAALDKLGIVDLADIRAAYYSAGQRRRLALARLVAVPRPLWLLDEPSVSLDAAATTMLARLIRDHVGTGGMVIAATHLELGVAGARELHLGAPSHPAEAA